MTIQRRIDALEARAAPRKVSGRVIMLAAPQGMTPEEAEKRTRANMARGLLIGLYVPDDPAAYRPPAKLYGG